MSLRLSKFDPRTIEERRTKGQGPATCVFIGKRGTGKSTLVADILYHCRKIPIGVAISATEDGNAFYSNYVPELFIHSEYKSDVVQSVVTRQKKVVSKDKDIKNDAFLLLDDCMYDKKMIRDPNIRGIFMNGRHWRITFMITMQYCMDLPPDLRANIDYIFILRENIIQNQEKLYKNFFGIFPHMDTFKEVMTACTEGYDCLVLDNTSRSNKITDCVFWYRAKPNRKFRIGSKELWSYNKKNLDKNVEKDSIDQSKLKKKNPNVPHVCVKKVSKKK